MTLSLKYGLIRNWKTSEFFTLYFDMIYVLHLYETLRKNPNGLWVRGWGRGWAGVKRIEFFLLPKSRIF